MANLCRNCGRTRAWHFPKLIACPGYFRAVK